MGQHFLESCRRLGLEVEYELHAMSELLPRRLFKKDRSLFRMDDKGERSPDANLCVHSTAALDLAAEKAVEFGRGLRPTTRRFFFWGDDGQPWCRLSFGLLGFEPFGAGQALQDFREVAWVLTSAFRSRPGVIIPVQNQPAILVAFTNSKAQ
jgi:hypothetical protein